MWMGRYCVDVKVLCGCVLIENRRSPGRSWLN